MMKRDPSLPIMSSHLDKEIGWITHAERANFEDALFSQPIGKCCEGRLSAERQALENLIRKTQLDLGNRAKDLIENEGGTTHRSTASDASAMAAAAADEVAPEQEDNDQDDESEVIAMLPSYEISKSGTIVWTFMDKMVGNLEKFNMLRKHDRPDDVKLYVPARCLFDHQSSLIHFFNIFFRHLCVGVLARGQLKEPLVHDSFYCPTVLKGEKDVVDTVDKRKTKKVEFHYMCKEVITAKNARTCASCGKTFCSKETCIFPDVELEDFEAPQGNGPKDKKAVVLKGPVCAFCKSAREEAKGTWIVKAPKPEEEPEKPGFFATLSALWSSPPLTDEQMEKEKERQEKAVRLCYCTFWPSAACILA
jgi:hypothetical protein